MEEKGSEHYKGGEVEPLDLMRSGQILWDFAIGSIIKYAYRNSEMRIEGKDTSDIKADLDKIKHYCEILEKELPNAE